MRIKEKSQTDNFLRLAGTQKVWLKLNSGESGQWSRRTRYIYGHNSYRPNCWFRSVIRHE